MHAGLPARERGVTAVEAIHERLGRRENRVRRHAAERAGAGHSREILERAVGLVCEGVTPVGMRISFLVTRLWYNSGTGESQGREAGDGR